MNKLRTFFSYRLKNLKRQLFCREVFANMSMHNGKSNGSHEYVDIESKFIKVGNVSTHLSQLGQLREPDGEKPRSLFLIIPGNPGVPTFYEDFMRELYNQSGGHIPVWTIGHAGHSRPPNKTLSLKDIVATDENTYGLQAQINHKVTFIKENVPSDVKLILIGHSIGCYMILNSLEDILPHSVQRCFMLFPTIERMAVSPNGTNLTPVFRYLRWLIIFVAFLCILLPQSLRLSLIHFIYRKADHPVCMTAAIMKTVTPGTVNFSTYLAKLEMGIVTDLQKDLVRKHLDKLSFYYGASDLWCPIQYYKDVTEEFPLIDARLCEFNMKHAFVMERTEGQKMAEVIWQWLQVRHPSKLFSNGHMNKETVY